MLPPAGALKRKTLVDRAGETSRHAPAPPSSKPINAHAKATSIAGVSRQVSHASSTSSRPASVSSIRNVSNTSFSSSVSSARLPPLHNFRPQLATPSTLQRPRIALDRSAGSVYGDTDQGQTTTQTNGNRTSMTPFHSSLRKYPTLQENSLRKRYDNQDQSIMDWSNSVPPLSRSVRRVKSLRDISLSTALSELSLNQRDCTAIPEDRIETPSTPSHIPKRKMSKISLVSTSAIPSRSPKKRPKLVPFLTKDSNTTAADWSLEDRMQNMESSYIEIKEKMSVTVVESNGLKESIGLYKARRRSRVCWTFLALTMDSQ